MFRDQTPPNTPQRVRTAARQSERDNRTLDSPEHRRIPQQPIHPQIQPLQFNNIPVPQVLPPAPNALPLDDPFAQPAPINFNGYQYHHLPADLAQAVQNVNAMPLAPLRRRTPAQVPPPVCFFWFFFLLYVFNVWISPSSIIICLWILHNYRQLCLLSSLFVEEEEEEEGVICLHLQYVFFWPNFFKKNLIY